MKRLVAVYQRAGRCVVHRCALTDSGWWQGIPPAAVVKLGEPAEETELCGALSSMIETAPTDPVGDDDVSGPSYRAEEWLYPTLGVRTERLFRRGLKSCGIEISESELGLFAYNRSGEIVWRTKMPKPDDTGELVRAVREALAHSE